MTIAQATTHHFFWQTPAAGADAYEVQKRVAQILDHSDESFSLGWRGHLKEEVQEIAEECSKEGWDGEDAIPISDLTKKSAEFFIDLLPDNIIPPHISPENTGEYSFDWNIRKNMIFSLSISEDFIFFAGIFGSEKLYGKTRIQDELPNKLSEIFKRYLQQH